MITDPWFYAVAVPAVLLVGLAKGGFGGPIALLGVPLMSLFIPPVQAAGILLPILVVMDITGLLTYRSTFKAPALWLLIPAAIIGIGVGWLAAAYVTNAHVRLIVGLTALVFSLDYFLNRGGRKARAKPGPRQGVFWGAVAGFTSFVAHAGGPPLAMYLLPQRLAPVLYAGTSVV
ncbi:MAG: sulfite exporter TauE/SafE family protein, partial [Pseudomonadota bacterium]